MPSYRNEKLAALAAPSTWKMEGEGGGGGGRGGGGGGGAGAEKEGRGGRQNLKNAHLVGS